MAIYVNTWMTYFDTLLEIPDLTRCFCTGQDVFVSLPTEYGKLQINAVLSLMFIR